jgi:hypothetical protein
MSSIQRTKLDGGMSSLLIANDNLKRDCSARDAEVCSSSSSLLAEFIQHRRQYLSAHLNPTCKCRLHDFTSYWMTRKNDWMKRLQLVEPLCETRKGATVSWTRSIAN